MVRVVVWWSGGGLKGNEKIRLWLERHLACLGPHDGPKNLEKNLGNFCTANLRVVGELSAPQHEFLCISILCYLGISVPTRAGHGLYRPLHADQQDHLPRQGQRGHISLTLTTPAVFPPVVPPALISVSTISRPDSEGYRLLN